MMEFNDLLKERRAYVGKTLEEVAEIVGVSKATVQRWESGQIKNLRRDKIAKLAEALETTPSYLMGWQDDPYDYDRDEDNRIACIPSDIYRGLREIHGDDNPGIWKAYQGMENDSYEENSKEKYRNSEENYKECELIRPTGMAPIVGTIPAGSPVLAQQNIEGYMPVMVKNPNEYFYFRVKGRSMINAGISDGSLVLIHQQNTAENGEIVACRVNGDEATLKRFKQVGETVVLLPENPDFQPIIVSCKDFAEGFAEIIGVAKQVTTSL